MPLVVPTLRFFVLFLNVYETFKTLKPPPPSARRGGQPSARAVTQRKRDLKGCMAVWVVWCCYAVYERTFNRVVGIFLPFYSEIKSVFLLFLLLTRAKGAEPLFLHVIRPLVRPYTSLLDPMLELSCDIGDFAFALLQVPLDYILSSPWFPSWCTGKLGREGESSFDRSVGLTDVGTFPRTDNHSRIPVLAVHNGPIQPSRVLSSCRGSTRSISDHQHSSGHPTVYDPADSRATLHRRSSSASLPAYNEHLSHDPPRYSGLNGDQISYPPASAYLASNHDAPVPSGLSTHNHLGTAPEYHSPEWRTYPAFPSAYPPTPLPASMSLPTSIPSRSSCDHRIISDSAYPPIPEDEQGFGEALETVHQGFPGSVCTSSVSTQLPSGINVYEESSDSTRQPDEDTLLDDSMCSSDAGLSEDDFGTSLRTPHRGLMVIPSSAYSSEDSLASALTPADNAPSLRTKTSSDSLGSGSSLAGRKRTYGGSQGNARSTIPISHSRNATLRGKPAPPPCSNSSEDEDEASNDSTKAKRQRVLDPPKRKSTVRPVAKGLGNPPKDTLSSRSATVRARVTTVESQGTTFIRSRTVNSTVKGRKPALVSRRATRGGPQGVIKSSSTSSSRSETLEGRVY